MKTDIFVLAVIVICIGIFILHAGPDDTASIAFATIVITLGIFVAIGALLGLA